jgi:hypothetical protein
VPFFESHHRYLIIGAAALPTEAAAPVGTGRIPKGSEEDDRDMFGESFEVKESSKVNFKECVCVYVREHVLEYTLY